MKHFVKPDNDVGYGYIAIHFILSVQPHQLFTSKLLAHVLFAVIVVVVVVVVAVVGKILHFQANNMTTNRFVIKKKQTNKSNVYL